MQQRILSSMHSPMGRMIPMRGPDGATGMAIQMGNSASSAASSRLAPRLAMSAAACDPPPAGANNSQSARAERQAAAVGAQAAAPWCSCSTRRCVARTASPTTTGPPYCRCYRCWRSWQGPPWRTVRWQSLPTRGRCSARCLAPRPLSYARVSVPRTHPTKSPLGRGDRLEMRRSAKTLSCCSPVARGAVVGALLQIDLLPTRKVRECETAASGWKSDGGPSEHTSCQVRRAALPRTLAWQCVCLYHTCDAS